MNVNRMYVNDETLFKIEMDVKKEKAEWQKYLEKARELTGIDVERMYKLSFEKEYRLKRTLRRERCLTITVYPFQINVAPEICNVETSPDLKLISLSHELGHVYRYKEWKLLGLSNIFHTSRHEERCANKFVYEKLSEQYSQEEARKKMRNWVEEWADVCEKVRKTRQIDDYAEKYLPFLKRYGG